MNKVKPLVAFVVTISLVSCSLSSSTEPLVDQSPKHTRFSAAKVENLISQGIDPDLFVEGNIYFFLYHEMAHALISEFELPVIGREEDAADRLATLIMTPEEKEDSPSYLIEAARGWFLSDEETLLSDIEWWDEHGTDKQRGYQIACLLYGADPQRFNSVAELVNLPEERRETCEDESIDNQNSWATLFDSFLPDQPASPQDNSIEVIYHPTVDYEDEREYLQSLGALEDIAESLSTEFNVSSGITVEADECNEPNAFWSAEDRSITLCYELVDEFYLIVEAHSEM